MTIVDYLWGVASEGLVVGMLFWVIMYLTVEGTSLIGALRAGLISEAVGNLPYLLGEGPTSPISIAMLAVGGYVFYNRIMRVGELTPLKAIYGLLMTYFALSALVACAP